MKVIFMRVPDDLHEAIAKLAKVEDRSINKQAERLLRKALKREGKL